MNRTATVRKMVYSALLTGVGFVLPFLTGQIPQIGSMLCPMHIPVLLCGFVCGWGWAFGIGLLLPLLRSLTLGAPGLFPSAVCMAVELAAYGLMSGVLYQILPKKKCMIYVSLIGAMIVGRIFWGGAMLLCMGISGGSFGIEAFWTGAVVKAIPGILLQIVLIPALVMILERTRVISNS